MSIKQAVKQFLSNLSEGDEFSSWQLQRYVKASVKKNILPDTCLRKMRDLRREGMSIICTDNHKSKYIKRSKQ